MRRNPLRCVGLIAILAACSGSKPAPRSDLQTATASPTRRDCERARAFRDRVPGLLEQGRLDRSVRVITMADHLCSADAPRTWATLISTLGELGHTEAARAVARRVLSSPQADPAAKAAASRALGPAVELNPMELDGLEWKATGKPPSPSVQRARDKLLAQAEVELLDPATVELPIGTFYPGDGLVPPVSFAVHPYGKEAALGYGRRVEIVALRDWSPMALYDVGSTIGKLAYNGPAFRDSGLVTASLDGSFQVFSLPSCTDKGCGDTEVLVAPQSKVEEFWVQPLTFGAEGRLVAWVEGKEVKVWDADNGKVVAAISVPERPSDVALDPRGTLLSVQINFTSWSVHDLATQKVILEASHFHASPDGAFVALLGKLPGAAEENASLHVWDAKKRLLRSAKNRGVSPDRGVAVSPTGRRIAAGAVDSELYVFDASTLGLVRTLRGPAPAHSEHEVYFAPVWGADDRTLLGEDPFGGYVVFDPTTGARLAEFMRSPVETPVYFGKAGSAAVLDLNMASSTVVESLMRKDRALAQALEENASTAMLGFFANGAVRRAVPLKGAETIYALSPEEKTIDGKPVVPPQEQRVVAGNADGMLALFDAATGELSQRLSSKFDDAVLMSRISWSPRGRWLTAADAEGSIRQIWNGWTGELVFRRPPRIDALRWVTGADGAELQVRSSNGLARVTARGLALQALPARAEANIENSRSNFDGTVQASPSQDGISILAVGRSPKILKGSTESALRIALTSDARRIAAVDRQGRIGVYDAHQGRRLSIFSLHRSKPLAVALSSDGRFAASCSSEDLFVWSADRGDVVWSVPQSEKPIRDCGELAVSLGADRVASGSTGHVTLWGRGQPVVYLGDGGGSPRALAFHPNGTLVAAAFEDGVVRLIRIADGKLVARLVPLGSGAVLQAPEGHFDVLGDASAEKGLRCLVGRRPLALALCEDRFKVPGLFERVLSGDDSFLEP